MRGNLLEEYLYDHTGQRVKKIRHLENGEVETTYYVDELVRVDEEETLYLRDTQGTLLVTKNSDGSREYHHPDHLGSASIITNEDGEVIEETSYYPFGMVQEGGIQRYTYTGQESDETGLMYYNSRYYDTTLRKFTQPDSIIPDMYNPQSLNRYSYVLNNPYKYTDPSGHDPYEFWSDLPTDTSGSDWIQEIHGMVMETAQNVAEQQAMDSSLGVVTENHVWKEYAPVTGDFLDIYGFFAGKTYYSNEKVSGGDRALMAVAAVIPLATYKNLKGLGKGTRSAYRHFFPTKTKTKIVRSQTQKKIFLKNLMEDGKNPKWMNQWFEKGKVPPGYHVDHIKPLSVGGKDLPENMRLLDIDGHKTHHKFYRPWQNK